MKSLAIVMLAVLTAFVLSGPARTQDKQNKDKDKPKVPALAEEIAKMEVSRSPTNFGDSPTEKTFEDQKTIGALLAFFPEVATKKKPDALVPGGGKRSYSAAYVITLHRKKGEPLYIVITIQLAGENRRLWFWTEGTKLTEGDWTLKKPKEVLAFLDSLLKDVKPPNPVEKLKANLDDVSVTVSIMPKGYKPKHKEPKDKERYVELYTNPKQPETKRDSFHHARVLITKEQADKLIDLLAADGFFETAAAQRKKLFDSQKPYAMVSIASKDGQTWVFLPWDGKLTRLPDLIRKQLDGDARKAMDELLTLEPLPKADEPKPKTDKAKPLDAFESSLVTGIHWYLKSVK